MHACALTHFYHIATYQKFVTNQFVECAHFKMCVQAGSVSFHYLCVPCPARPIFASDVTRRLRRPEAAAVASSGACLSNTLYSLT